MNDSFYDNNNNNISEKKLIYKQVEEIPMVKDD
jgi:hypothetical protein